MRRFRVRGGHPLEGSVRVPGDKSIGHRALIFAALADGQSRVTGLSDGLDNRATRAALSAMGVAFDHGEDGSVIVDGAGLDGLRLPRGPIDCGNSGTTMRLLAGLLAGQQFGARLIGDDSLTKRPMRRVIEPLRARGAQIAGTIGPREGELYPPISIAPLLSGEALRPLEYEMKVASAQVKSALLLSGLYANGLTAIREPVLSRDHTERMMLALGVPLETFGPMTVLDPADWSRRWASFDWTVPGDFSSAAFLIAAALIVPSSRVQVMGVGINPTRTGLLDALRGMGAHLTLTPKGSSAGDEPMADLEITSGGLRGGAASGELLTRMIDEVPAFAAVAATANGTTEIADAAELRVKESDRISAMVEALRSFGITCDEAPDGFVVRGGARLHAGHVRSHGDHRIAMAGVLLGLAAEGETLVDDVECVETSYVGFADTLRRLGAAIEEEET